jgi:hypothetical protein
VEIHAVDTYLQREIDNAVKKIKDPIINFQSDIDLKPVRTKIKALRSELKAAPLQLKIDVNYEEVLDNIDAIRHQQENEDVRINFDPNTDTLETALASIQNRFTDMNSTVNANADTAAAETQLNYVARNRSSTVSMNLDPRTAAAFQGLMFTLIGAIPADKIKGALTGIATNFESLALAAGKVTTAVGTAGASIGTLGANLFGIAGDLTKVVGLAAAAPAFMSAFAAGIAVTTIAWNGFGDAISGKGKKGAEALAKLPKQAQDAALALRDLGKQLSAPIQKAFWEEMGTSLQDTAAVVIPRLSKGLQGTATQMARFTEGVLASFKQMAASGGLDTLFKNINTGFGNLSKGAKPFFDALNTLSVSGSKFLGPFGTFLADAAIRFNNFITSAEKAGKITIWIQEAVNTVKQLGSVVSSTTGIFKGLVEASRLSGGAGLRDFANGMKGIADTVNGEPFQSRLVMVLEGARRGTEALGDGFGKLMKVVGDSSVALGEFLAVSGRITGGLLGNLSAMFNGTGLGSGLLEMLDGLESAMITLEPGFRDLGSIVGDLGEIAGEVFRNMAPGINNLLSTISGVIAGLKDGVIAAMPVFNEFTQNILALASGPIIAIAQGFGNLLSIFAQLPGPLQTIITSLTLLVLFRSRITGLFSAISGSFATMRSGIAGDTEGLSKSMQNMYKHFGNAGTSLGSVGNAIRNIPFAAATSGLGGIATAAGGALKSLGSAAGQGLRGALSGGAAMLGGPWGIALGAGIALLSAYGQAQADSAAKVKDLSGTLEQQTGKITAATKGMMAQNVLDGATNGFDDFVRGVLQGSASVEETLRDMGLSTKDFVDKLSDPSGRDSFIKGLDEIAVAVKLGKPITDEMAAAVGKTKEELSGISGQSFAHLATKARDAAGELTKAEQNVRAIAEATGTNSAQASILAKNYETLASSTSSANDKFSALKQNLDILNGGAMTMADSQQAAAQAVLNTGSAFAKIKEDAGGAVQSLYSVKDGFNFATQAGIDLRTAVSGSTDSILQLGTAALQQALAAGKSTADANSIAIQAMQPGIAGLRSQLSTLGLAQPQIDSIIRSFGLMPDQIATAISVTGADKAQRDIMLVKLAGDAFANGNYKAVLAALPEPAKAAIASAMGDANVFKEGRYDAILAALDQTGPGKEAALAQILSVTNGDYTAALKAADLTAPAISSATGAAVTYKTGSYEAKLTAVNMNGDPVANARIQANAYKNADYTAELEAVNRNLGPVANAKAQALGYKNADYTAEIEARNLVGLPVAQATGALNGVPNIFRNITANDHASGVAYAARDAISTVQSKTVDVVVRYSALGKPGINADGNIWPAAFANGGIQTFATGGFSNLSENHVAQIARGAWPARMWAEPETGGEAYIPLALSKRIRSLKILQTVAEMFGFSLMKKFAEGGMMPAMTPSTSSVAPLVPSSSALGMSSRTTTTAQKPTIIVNVYPPAGMDTRAVGKSVIQELNWQIQSQT